MIKNKAVINFFLFYEVIRFCEMPFEALSQIVCW